MSPDADLSELPPPPAWRPAPYNAEDETDVAAGDATVEFEGTPRGASVAPARGATSSATLWGWLTWATGPRDSPRPGGTLRPGRHAWRGVANLVAATWRWSRDATCHPDAWRLTELKPHYATKQAAFDQWEAKIREDMAGRPKALLIGYLVLLGALAVFTGSTFWLGAWFLLCGVWSAVVAGLSLWGRHVAPDRGATSIRHVADGESATDATPDATVLSLTKERIVAALRAHHLIGESEDIGLSGGRAEVNGCSVVVKLPPSKIAASILTARDKIAGGLDSDIPLVAVEPIKGSARSFRLREYATDPMDSSANPSPPSPLVHAERTWVHRPIRLGRTLDGRTVTMRCTDGAHLLIAGGTGSGKAQPVDEPVLTPGGWVPIGSIKPGDEVIGQSGKATMVTHVHPQGVRPVMRVTFSDGSWTRCDPEHLWTVRSKAQKYLGIPWRTFTAVELAGELHRGWQVPTVEPAHLADVPLPVDPYTLGVLLGDGGLSNHTLRLSTDEWIWDRLGVTGRIYSHADCGYVVDVFIHDPALRSALDSLGLLGKRSWEKHVPPIYLLGTPADRLALLRGLMDTDGTAKGEFSTTSEQMARSMVELVQSLGGTASITDRVTKYTYRGEKKDGRRSWRVRVRMPADLCPFLLPRKADAWVAPTKYPPTRTIRSIELDGNPVEQVCIQVAAPDQLYVTRSYAVTHNSNACRVRGLAYALDPDATQTVIDAKGSPALRLYRPVAHVFSGTDPVVQRAAAKHIRELATVELNRRMEVLARYAEENPGLIADDGIDDAMARHRDLNVPYHQVWIDECHTVYAYSAPLDPSDPDGEKCGQVIAAGVKTLITQGRSLGFTVDQSTQRPSASNMDTDIRAIATGKLCGSLEEDADARMVFGARFKERGIDPVAGIQSHVHVGWMFLTGAAKAEPADLATVLVHCDLADVTATKMAIDRAHRVCTQLRPEILPDGPSSQRPAPALEVGLAADAPERLEEMQSCFSGAERELLSVTIIRRLREEYPADEVYRGLTARSMNTFLKPFGLRTTSVREGDKKGKGLTLSALIEARNACPDRSGDAAPLAEAITSGAAAGHDETAPDQGCPAAPQFGGESLNPVDRPSPAGGRDPAGQRGTTRRHLGQVPLPVIVTGPAGGFR